MDIKNADPKKTEELLNTLGKKLGMPPEQLRNELMQGKFDSALKNMKPDEAAKFNRVMNDPSLLEKLMSAPQAQALYKKLSEGK
ncbi:MAG: hypothetical protein II773_11780 [Oscillospiraceae bacterium]|nr:hypothetical protein [Oscillospiraceae bacterium]MBQ4312258.1 hypothetical protein [Oscillospiraceae bacterium]